MYIIVQYSTCTLQYSTVQYSTVQYSTVLHGYIDSYCKASALYCTDNMIIVTLRSAYADNNVHTCTCTSIIGTLIIFSK